MKARARELKEVRRPGSDDGERQVERAIRAMPAGDRQLAQKFHGIVRKHAPMLTPKTWYGMPAYAKEGQVLCFFQNASKFKTRYATIGFSDEANLDEGGLWPVGFAVVRLSAKEEGKIVALLRRALTLSAVHVEARQRS